MSRRSWTSALPENYAAEKQPLLDKRWDRELGECLRAMVPVAWPGVPETVFLGFTAFSTSSKENTTEAVENQRFHEIGYFQTEAGMRDKPAPDPDENGEYNNWGKLHDDPLVMQLLGGRKATMAADGWKKAIPDQTAIGLVNLRKKLNSGMKRMIPGLAPTDLASPWAVLLSFTMFSRGVGQTMKCLAPYDEKLAKLPEAERWSAWENMIAADIVKSIDSIGNKDGKGGAPWAYMRTRQKSDSGKLFAQRKNLPLIWYPPSDSERDKTIVRRAYDIKAPA